ncbi:MAG TPA: DUF3592 domain-containing protein [Thermoanaerobaculia bacterium]|jgi:hypothetical protein
MRLTISSPAGGKRGLGGKIVGSLFFLAFLAMGLWFAGLVVYSFYRGVRTYAWDPAECLILESGVDEHPEAAEASEAYQFRVRYAYSAQGARYTSDRYRPGYSGSSDIGEARQLADRYRLGSRVACYVDPAKPDSAVLRRPSLWFGFIILLPLLFVAVGGGGLYALWKPDGDGTPALPRLQQKIQNANPKGCMVAFFGVFLLAGGVFSLFFVQPALKVLAAKSWEPTPCVIVSSQVRSHAGDDSTTYSVDVLYTYTYNGWEYKSNRYQFLGGSSGGYAEKERIVRRLPPLTRTTCYVNPKEPAEAVLNRDFSYEYAFGFVPLLFVAVGLGGIVFTLRSVFQGRS